MLTKIFTWRGFKKLFPKFLWINLDPKTKNKFRRINYILSDNLVTTKWNGTPINFYISDVNELRRAEKTHNEPSTQKWIDSFEKDDVFWDVGACIGVFTLYAAKRVGCRVFSFEPVFHNYNILNRNIILNSLQDKVTAYCLSLHDSFDVSKIYLGKLQSATSCSDFNNDRNENRYGQGSIGIPIDTLIDYLPAPNHIKIDVDGNEKLIIDGMKKVLKNKNLKSVLVEINSSDKEEVVQYFKDNGFETILNEFTGMNRGEKSVNYIFKKIK